MKHEKLLFRCIDPYVTRQKLIQSLVKGLDRALTYDEVKVLNWICDSDCETRGIILGLFTELIKRQDGK